MKKINKKILIITSIVCLLPIILGLIFYNQMPEEIAIHFDINNNANGYFSKPAFVFGMPIMILILQAFCCIVSDLSDKNPEANKKTVTVYKWIIPILSIILYCITIMTALGNNMDIRKIVMCVLGILFIITGNYLPKTVGNYNIRCIKKVSEEFDKKIIRITAYMLILNGLLAIGSILFNSIVSAILVGLIIIETIILYVYSYIKSKKV